MSIVRFGTLCDLCGFGSNDANPCDECGYDLCDGCACRTGHTMLSDWDADSARRWGHPEEDGNRLRKAFRAGSGFVLLSADDHPFKPFWTGKKCMTCDFPWSEHREAKDG